MPRDVTAHPTLTPADLEVLSAIAELRGRGKRPTIRAIGAELGHRSPGSVQRHVSALLHLQRLVRTGDGLEVPDPTGHRPAVALALVPLVSRHPLEGKPITAPENVVGYIPPLPDFLGSGQHCFALRVADSALLAYAGIAGGDLVYATRGIPTTEGFVVTRNGGGPEGSDRLVVRHLHRGSSGILLMVNDVLGADDTPVDSSVEGVVIAALRPLGRDGESVQP